MVGIILGCQPIISYNIGAKKIKRVKELYLKILFCTIIIGIIFTLLFEFCPKFVVGLFGNPTNIPNLDDYWEFGSKTFRIFLCLVLFTCIVKMTSIFFQAVGKPFKAILASIIRKIADQGSCVIVGRAADYVLRDYDNVIRIFIYANNEFKTNRIMELYNDTIEEAKKYIKQSDEKRATYYNNISGLSSLRIASICC